MFDFRDIADTLVRDEGVQSNDRGIEDRIRDMIKDRLEDFIEEQVYLVIERIDELNPVKLTEEEYLDKSGALKAYKEGDSCIDR